MTCPKCNGPTVTYQPWTGPEEQICADEDKCKVKQIPLVDFDMAATCVHCPDGVWRNVQRPDLDPQKNAREQPGYVFGYPERDVRDQLYWNDGKQRWRHSELANGWGIDNVITVGP